MSKIIERGRSGNMYASNSHRVVTQGERGYTSIFNRAIEHITFSQDFAELQQLWDYRIG